MAKIYRAFGELQQPTFAQSTGFSGSAGAVDGAAAAVNGRDMNGHGWHLGSMRATEPVHFGISSPNHGGDGGGSLRGRGVEGG